MSETELQRRALEEALGPAVATSLARHATARPAFIGMHLLSTIEKTAPPLAPPWAPRHSAEMQCQMKKEMSALETILGEALTKCTADQGDDLMRRLAAYLIESDAGRRERALRYTSPEAIWEKVESGDIVLIRSSWLLKRAGFAEVGSGVWAPRDPPQPMPRRQEIESDFPEAIMPLSEIKQQHRNFLYAAAEATSTWGGEEPVTAASNGAEAVPVVTVCHCWETEQHADPEGRTLRIIAAELADGGWELGVKGHEPRGCPTCGLPLYHAWGMEEVGIFWDWCSLYQLPRTEEQSLIFRRAFADMAVIFAHRLVTCYLLKGQGAHLTTARELRGWPFYEEEIAMLLKSSAPRGTYDVGRDGPCMLWSKVVQVTREPVMFGGGGVISRAAQRPSDDPSTQRLEQVDVGATRTATQIATREAVARLARLARRKPPPLSPAHFAEAANQKQFANGTDCAALVGLYRAVMEDGFGGLQYLRLAECGWGDEEVASLALTLREVRAPELLELDLSVNETWINGEVLEPAIETFRHNVGCFKQRGLHALKTLKLAHCVRLVSLPATLGHLKSLTLLDVSWCESLQKLPDSAGELESLQTLDVSHCANLTCLPTSCSKLRRLSSLNLDFCETMQSLPDLSRCQGLKVEFLPSRMREWEDRGRTQFDYWATGPSLDAMQVDLSFIACRKLPVWLFQMSGLQELTLNGCESLESLEGLSALTELRFLDLTGCSSLMSLESLEALQGLKGLNVTRCTSLRAMPDLSALGEMCNVTGLPAALAPWESTGRKAWKIGDVVPESTTVALPPSDGSKVMGDDEARERDFRAAQEAELAELLAAEEAEKAAKAPTAPVVEVVSASSDGEKALAYPGLAWGDFEVSKMVEGLQMENPYDVTTLNLSGNGQIRGSSLVALFEKLPGLTMIDFTDCYYLNTLPDDLGSKPVKELILRTCMRLYELPDSICNLSMLHTLDLRECEALEALPGNIGALTSLVRLYISSDRETSMQAVPASLWTLKTLRHLELCCAGLANLPPEISELRELQTLVISGPNALPDSLSQLKRLEYLQISQKVATLPDSMFSGLSQLRTLNLGSCVTLTSLTESIEGLAALEVLYIGSIELVSLPDAVCRLKLDHLELECPQLISLPEAIGDLGGTLRSLYIRYYPSSSLPENLGQLTQLNALKLNKCEALTNLPDALCNLAGLQMIEVSECPALKCLPQNFDQLTSLKLFNFDGSEDLADVLYDDPVIDTLEARGVGMWGPGIEIETPIGEAFKQELISSEQRRLNLLGTLREN